VPAAARASLLSDGQVMVETAAHGAGSGAFTVIAQTAARKLGFNLPRIGDSRLPPGQGRLRGMGQQAYRGTIVAQTPHLWRICGAPDLTALIVVNQRCDGFGPRQQYFDTQTVFAIPVAPWSARQLRQAVEFCCQCSFTPNSSELHGKRSKAKLDLSRHTTRTSKINVLGRSSPSQIVAEIGFVNVRVPTRGSVSKTPVMCSCDTSPYCLDRLRPPSISPLKPVVCIPPTVIEPAPCWGCT
jgi:Molybdopterin-binding domain of aldehyde dehydrogenase